MSNGLFSTLQFQGQALSLRAERQTVLASNIANTDTPNYKARDFDFAGALSKASGVQAEALTRSPGSAAPLPMTPSGTGSGQGGESTGGSPGPWVMAASSAIPNPRHFAVPTDGSRVLSSSDARMMYRQPEQASIDGNTVEIDRERAAFADNAVRYEATLRFINGHVRTLLSAIKGE